MTSPGEFKGQRRGACGLIMAAFDMHESCARYRDKKLGQDPCVQDKPYSICDNFSDLQKETLSTPSYRIRKDRKAVLLVSSKEVVSFLVLKNCRLTPVNQSTCTVLHPSAQDSMLAPDTDSTSTQEVSYVTSEQFSAMSEMMAEQFARFEALLSRGNVFSAKMSITPVSSHQSPS